MRRAWATVSIPLELAQQIDEVLKIPERPYRSRGDFAADAVRRLIRQLREASHKEEA